MLQTRKHGTALASFSAEKIFDLDNGGYRLARLSEKLETNRTRMVWHAVQNPTRRGNQAIGTFLLHTR